MKSPTIHLNGSGKDGLLRGYLDAASALQRGLEALAGCRPHPRDYYPQGDDAFLVAQEEHLRREEKVEVVLREIEALALKVSQ